MLGKLKILIVDDEFISRTLLGEMLAPFGACYFVTNGIEAITILEKSYNEPNNRFDLVCIDIFMPEMNGHQVLREMRRIEQRKEIDRMDAAKVLMVTALDDAKNIMEAMIVGRCQAYLSKPVSRETLVEQLRLLHLLEGVSSGDC